MVLTSPTALAPVLQHFAWTPKTIEHKAEIDGGSKKMHTSRTTAETASVVPGSD